MMIRYPENLDHVYAYKKKEAEMLDSALKLDHSYRLVNLLHPNDVNHKENPAQHDTRYHDNLSQYDDSHQHISDQQYAKQLQINQYEEDRIGKGRIGTVGGFVDGVGRPSSHNLDSRNKKQYEPKEQQVVAQYTDPHKPFDKDEAQALMDSVSKNKEQG